MRTEEFKGTKGKWSFRTAISKGCFYIETVDQSHQETFIGEVGGGLQSGQSIKANAQLIAAAPEMLDILIQIAEARRIGNELALSEIEDVIDKALGIH